MTAHQDESHQVILVAFFLSVASVVVTGHARHRRHARHRAQRAERKHLPLKRPACENGALNLAKVAELVDALDLGSLPVFTIQ